MCSAICSAIRRASTPARAPIRAPTFPHRDGIVLYILEYANGLRASAWDDVWAGPAREGAAPDIYIKWRVEGTDGLAQGTIGWPGYPNAVPSTMQFATKQQPGCWISPKWSEAWFPDAFEGTDGRAAVVDRREAHAGHRRARQPEYDGPAGGVLSFA